jgi:putative hydrolase of the HAD superfamily
MPLTRITALTLDLDDTLWPIGPVIQRAENTLHAWLSQHAPQTAAMHDVAGLRRVRDQVAHTHPELAHDLTAVRLEGTRLALLAAGDDPALAVPAFEAFIAARHDIAFYDDALPALRRLAARYPLLAVSNGNADLRRIGLGDYFVGSLSARDCGVAKPDPRIFEAACQRLGQPPSQVLHVGDDVRLDVIGAQRAGLPAAWIQRPDHAEPPLRPEPPVHHYPDLQALADALGC